MQTPVRKSNRLRERNLGLHEEHQERDEGGDQQSVEPAAAAAPQKRYQASRQVVKKTSKNQRQAGQEEEDREEGPNKQTVAMVESDKASRKKKTVKKRKEREGTRVEDQEEEYDLTMFGAPQQKKTRQEEEEDADDDRGEALVRAQQEALIGTLSQKLAMMQPQVVADLADEMGVWIDEYDDAQFVAQRLLQVADGDMSEVEKARERVLERRSRAKDNKVEEEKRTGQDEAGQQKKEASRKRGEVIKPAWSGFGVRAVSAEALTGAKRGEFIKLVKFLPVEMNNATGQRDDDDVIVISGGSVERESRAKREMRNRKIDGVNTLTEAYWSALAAHTEEGQDKEALFQWSKHFDQLLAIMKAKRSWEVALWYSEARREKVMSQGGYLGDFDEELYQQVLRTHQPYSSTSGNMSSKNSGKTRSSGNSNSSSGSSDSGSSMSKTDTVCRSWNWSRCHFKPCRFKHVCAECGNDEHTARQHTQPRQPGREEERQASKSS
jgi:hypothetical protein